MSIDEQHLYLMKCQQEIADLNMKYERETRRQEIRAHFMKEALKLTILMAMRPLITEFQVAVIESSRKPEEKEKPMKTTTQVAIAFFLLGAALSVYIGFIIWSVWYA